MHFLDKARSPTFGDLLICAKDLFVAATDEKAPAIDGRGKLAEWDWRLFDPSRPAPSEERL